MFFVKPIKTEKLDGPEYFRLIEVLLYIYHDYEL